MTSESLKQCRKCKKVKSLDDFHKDRSKRDGRRTRCRDCENADHREYTKKFHERILAANRRNYYKNVEKSRKERKEAYWRQPEIERARARARYQNNPEVRAANLQRHQGVKLRALAVVTGGNPIKCSYCPESNPAVLEIDHVNGDGHQARNTIRKKALYYQLIREGLPTDTVLQILCEKHNAMKSWLSHAEFMMEINTLYHAPEIKQELEKTADKVEKIERQLSIFA